MFVCLIFRLVIFAATCNIISANNAALMDMHSNFINPTLVALNTLSNAVNLSKIHLKFNENSGINIDLNNHNTTILIEKVAVSNMSL